MAACLPPAQGLTNHTVEGSTVNILGLVGHKVSVATLNFVLTVGATAATDNMEMHRCAWVQIKHYLPKTNKHTHKR